MKASLLWSPRLPTFVTNGQIAPRTLKPQQERPALIKKAWRSISLILCCFALTCTKQARWINEALSTHSKVFHEAAQQVAKKLVRPTCCTNVISSSVSWEWATSICHTESLGLEYSTSDLVSSIHVLPNEFL